MARNELIPLPETGTEVALPEDIVAKAKHYATHSRAERTRTEYKRCVRDFIAWCDRHGRDARPASVHTVAAYLTWMASGRDGGKSLATSTITQALSAIKLAQRTAGHPFDSDSPIIKEVMKGIRRSIATERTIRRVKPLLQEDLRDILDGLNPDSLREARDAALLALGWAGALRRSELVGLDWGQRGTVDGGKGFLTIDEKGIVVTLLTSKASQDEAQTIAIPRTFAPQMCEAVENLVRVGNIGVGTPLFRGTDGRSKDGKRFRDQRLWDRTVPTIIKRRIQLLAKAKGRRKLSKEEVGELVKQFSGHSMRSGYVTSAAARDVPSHRIRAQTRHKTEAMIAIYIREDDKMKNSGLKGVGF